MSELTMVIKDRDDDTSRDLGQDLQSGGVDHQLRRNKPGLTPISAIIYALSK